MKRIDQTKILDFVKIIPKMFFFTANMYFSK